MNDEKWLELAFGDPDKANELKQKEEDRKAAVTSGKQKLLDLGLTEEEIQALMGV
jgi:hypothetical protein|tara:strand:- start:149 stop:313 length:165 start_codon:yes stop_codon:yes gene_type:complete